MESVSHLFEVIEHLNFHPTQYIVAGSAPLLIHGIRSSIQDLDIVVNESLWNRAAHLEKVAQSPYDDVQIIHRELYGFPVEILNGWFPCLMGWDTQYLINNADIIRGINFIPLRLTLSWKKALRRKNDLEDIQKIAQFLSAESA